MAGLYTTRIATTSRSRFRSRAEDSIFRRVKGIASIAGWVILGLLLLVSFGIDFANTAQGGAIDLRNRITGARLLAHDIDPYHYKWREPEPGIYCDPYNNPLLKVSKTTATPALLMLHLPPAALPYRLAQMLWFLMQWALLLATAWIWLWQCEEPWRRWAWAAIVTGFTYTAAWRLHTERGQAYVLLLFLFAWWLAVTLKAKEGNVFWAGLLAGFLAALRPPFLLLVPFLALHRRGQLAGAAVGLVLGVGLPLLVNPACWTDYFSAIETGSELYRNGYDPSPPPQKYPATMEGVPTDILANHVAIPYADFSIHAFLRWIGIAPFPALPLLFAVTVPFALWLWLSRKWPVAPLLPGLAAWLFLVDLFLPAYRNTYNDVLILNVMALGIVTGDKWSWGNGMCALAIPLGWGVYAFTTEQAWVINLPTLFFTLGALLFLFLFTNRAAARRIGRAC